MHFVKTVERFAARPMGLACGLALAVRPAWLAEVSGVKGGRLRPIALATRRRRALDTGWAAPDNGRRSVPVSCDLSPGDWRTWRVTTGPASLAGAVKLAGEAGGSLRELMHRIGHSTTRAALIYQHRTSLRDKMIADEISRRAGAERPQSGTQRARDEEQAS